MTATSSAEHTSFGAQLRRLRAERSWSLRDLADRITYNRGYIGKVEQGEKFPDRQFAERKVSTSSGRIVQGFVD